MWQWHTTKNQNCYDFIFAGSKWRYKHNLELNVPWKWGRRIRWAFVCHSIWCLFSQPIVSPTIYLRHLYDVQTANTDHNRNSLLYRIGSIWKKSWHCPSGYYLNTLRILFGYYLESIQKFLTSNSTKCQELSLNCPDSICIVYNTQTKFEI